MPELPEVETSRKNLEKALKGKKLIEVMPDYEDSICYDRQTGEEFREAIEGATVIGSGRKGKYFWLKLDRRPWPVFHLGMTGNVEIRKMRGNFKKAWGGVKLWSEGKKDPAMRFLSYCRLRITAEDGTEMAITDPRRFGRIRLADDPETEIPISRLGFDPLIEFPNAKELFSVLQKRRAPIKAVLLDQKVFAGVGNWIADEVLFQSGISPHRLAAKLSEKEVAKLRLKLLHVIRVSVKVDADYDRYPKHWLFHHRWGKKKDASTSRQLKITHDTIGGRTTAWVPKVQI